jgi:hypothetical protein
MHSTLRGPGLIMGLGRESCVPPRPRLGLLNVSRPSASNDHVWILPEQNAVDALAQTLGFIRASSRHAALRSSPRDGTSTGPLASARAHRWVDAPPSSGSSTEPYPRTAASERPRSLVDERRGGGWRHRGPSRRRAPPPMGGRAAVERLLGGALPAQPWRVPSPLLRAVARDLPMRLTDPRSTVVCKGKQISA